MNKKQLILFEETFSLLLAYKFLNKHYDNDSVVFSVHRYYMSSYNFICENGLEDAYCAWLLEYHPEFKEVA